MKTSRKKRKCEGVGIGRKEEGEEMPEGRGYMIDACMEL